LNGSIALALLALLVVIYLPTLRAFEVHRADLGYRGEWIQGHASRITAVTPGGAVDQAGLRPGDVLEFDPARDDDWVLAGYRQMPGGFRGSLPVRHQDGTTSVVGLEPGRVALLPTFSDRAAWTLRLVSAALLTSLAVFLIWARPGLMTWCLLLWFTSGWPVRLLTDISLAVEARSRTEVLAYMLPVSWSLAPVVLPFAVSFPRGTWTRREWWQGTIVAGVWLALVIYLCGTLSYEPFARDWLPRGPTILWGVVSVSTYAVGIGILVHNYRRSDQATQARLKWAILGMSTALALYSVYVVQVAAFFSAERALSFSEFTPAQWLFAFTSLLVWPASFGYALLRERVVDIQFAISRTVVYGIVTTLVLVFIAVLHWLFGRMIEHSGLAFGLEGLAAVGLGLVLHRASHGINVTVDRVLFRKHHAAEQRLRQVTAALPYASTERSIAEALVNEPARNLKLASVALFYRDSPEGSLRRVRSEGWSESHASSLDPESFLVRYVQAEHTAVRLDDEQQWLPPGVPEGSARPMLAVPMVSQHALSAVVLYGSHVNGTLPDPDEVELLAALARAAATSHQQVRIATLTREKEAAEHQAETERARNAQLEASLQLLAKERG
jgi:hypothetical protein